MEKDIPIDYLRECFSYDPESGFLAWLPRPREHFSSYGAWRSWSTRYGGSMAGPGVGGDHRRVEITFGGKRVGLLVHRAIWAIVTGEWPLSEIDHINRVRDDNRWVNLREATDAEQSWNRSMAANNTSGFVGVSWHKPLRKWRTQIQVNTRKRHIGYFPTRELAYEAYLAAKARLHPFQPLPRAA